MARKWGKSFTLLCDDVRIEHNGKMIIIGMYNPDILLRSTPAQLQALTLVWVIENQKIEINKVKVVLSLPGNNESVFEGEATKGELPKRSMHHISFAPVFIKEFGNSKFEIFINDEEKASVTHAFKIKKI